jgi:hypothetical protein
MPMPSVSMPQPVPWVSATTPSTLGSRQRLGLVWREKWSAMARAAVAEQFTLESTPM